VQEAFVTDGISQNTIIISDTNYAIGKTASVSASVPGQGPEKAIDISTSDLDEGNSNGIILLRG